MSKLVLMADKRPTKGKFVALYNDGSGADIYYISDNKSIIDANDGYSYDDERLDDYLYWFKLPDDYSLWCEK